MSGKAKMGAEPKLRASGAAPALFLALFQCWYVHLPDSEAVRFHQCRFNEHLDCYKSLSVFGSDMTPFGIPVFATLAAIYLLTCLLLAAAPLASELRRDSFREWAALLAFPATGLSIYVLLNDILNAHTSSLSTILLLAIGLGLSVLTVLRSVSIGSLKASARAVAAFALVAFAAGFLLNGAGRANLAATRIEIEREGEPAALRWSRFAHSLPRVSAAHLGNPTARRELLLFVDPSQEASRDVMRAAAAVKLGGSVCIYFYSTDGALLQAHRNGSLAEYLKTGTGSTEVADAKTQMDIARKLGINEYPTAWWHNGKKTGAIDVAAIVASLKQR